MDLGARVDLGAGERDRTADLPFTSWWKVAARSARRLVALNLAVRWRPLASDGLAAMMAARQRRHTPRTLTRRSAVVCDGDEVVTRCAAAGGSCDEHRARDGADGEREAKAWVTPDPP